jgi:sugar lactone lactonase YvrE
MVEHADLTDIRVWWNTVDDFSTAVEVGSDIAPLVGTTSNIALTGAGNVTGYLYYTMSFPADTTGNYSMTVESVTGSTADNIPLPQTTVLNNIPLPPAPPPVYQRIKAVTDRLEVPSSIATDANDRIYVAETSANRLNIYSPGGLFLKQLTKLKNPFSVAVDSLGRIYVGNGKTGNVEVYDYDLNLLSMVGSGNGEFKIPCAIAIDNTDNIYVADCKEDLIKKYNPDGSFSFSFGSSGSGNGQFNSPASIAIDDGAGELIIADNTMESGMMGAYQNPRIQIFDKDGNYIRRFGIRGVGEGKLFRPNGVAVDAKNRIYVSDAYQNVVQVFDNAGAYLTSLYDLTYPLMNPMGMAIGKSNRLFVAVHGSESVEIYGLDNYKNMVVAPQSLYFEGSEGGAAPALKNLDISNSGTDVINWSASSPDSWIALSEVSGSLNQGEMSTVNVEVNLAGFVPGTYTGSIEVTEGSGITETVSVTLKVTLPPALSVSPSSLVFDSINGQVPLTQLLSIHNLGEGTLDWTASSGKAWISLDKNAGTAPDAVNVTVDPSSMAEGTYIGNISVEEAGVPGSPVVVPVTLNVISITGTINVTTNHAGATFVINGPASYAGSGTSWSAAEISRGTLRPLHRA